MLQAAFSLTFLFKPCQQCPNHFQADLYCIVLTFLSMIFTFPTSKTNEGFFFNRRFICSHSFRHNRDHKENSIVLHSLVSQKTLRHRRKFSMLRSTLEDLTDQCCDHWMVFRSTPSCTISHNGLQ